MTTALNSSIFFAGIERPVEDHLITLFGFLQKKTHHRMEASNLDKQ